MIVECIPASLGQIGGLCFGPTIQFKDCPLPFVIPLCQNYSKYFGFRENLPIKTIFLIFTFQFFTHEGYLLIGSFSSFQVLSRKGLLGLYYDILVGTKRPSISFDFGQKTTAAL